MMFSKWMMPAIVMTGLMGGATSRAGAAFVTLTPSDGLIMTYPGTTPSPAYESATDFLQVADVLASMFGPRESFKKYSVIKFDLSSIPASARVTSAVLTFTLSNGLYPLVTPPALLSVTSGGSSTTTVTPGSFTGPLASPANASLYLPDYQSFYPAGVSPPPSVDETATVRAILGMSPALAVNFSIGGQPAWFGIGTPTLTVTFEPVAVPEPSSLAMCGVAGLAGVVFWDRRRRSPPNG